MIFDRSWVLFLTWLPLAWALFEWRKTRRKLGLAFKALSFLAVLIALAEPRWSLNETKLAVSVLVDSSASASPADLDRASELSRKISSASGRHVVNVIPFANSIRALAPAEQKTPFHVAATQGEAARSTNLEAAVTEAIAALPAGLVPRLALISDGKENAGSVARAAWQAKQLGIPIDTYALAGRAKPALNLASASLPTVAFTGEQFPIDLVISAPQAGPAQVDLAAEGHSLGSTQVQLQAGQNPLRMHASLNTPGALELSVTVKPVNSGGPDTGEIHFQQAMVLRRPKVLFVSNDTEQEDISLLAALNSAQFDVKLSNAMSVGPLNEFQLIVFNNWDLESIADSRKKDLEEYVRAGGGLLVVAGDRNVYTEDRIDHDPLERALPADLAPPRSPEGTAVTLIIDKSSSMEGRKMELARRAAIGVINNLRPVDMVSVLMFDNTFEWAVTMRKAEDKTFINRQISAIQPDGGTQIAPALAEAYAKMRGVTALTRHIVLMTDGISEEGNSVTLAKSALAEKITISTVGIGQDVNQPYLQRVAAAAGGKSYLVTDLAQLEQIMVRDVLEHTGQTAVEKPLGIDIAKHVEILNDTGIEKAPQLKGYVRFVAKPSAETILTLDRDPLLSRWQYGLGRAAVFASDAKSRWAADWISWPGYNKFWTNVARDLLPRAQTGETTLEYDSANGDLVANYRLGPGVAEPSTIPPVFVFGPDGFQKPIPIQKTAAGTFQGRLPIGDRQGLFRVRPAGDSQAFPETGLYRPESELSEYGNNVELLKQVAAFTGGRFEPAPEAVFQSTGRSIASSLSLWPALLGLAIILSLTELIMRKWSGILGKAAV